MTRSVQVLNLAPVTTHRFGLGCGTASMRWVGGDTLLRQTIYARHPAIYRRIR